MSRNFDFGDLRWGQFCDLTIMTECKNAQMPFFQKYVWGMLIIPMFYYIRPLSMTHMQFWSNYISFRSFEVIWSQLHFISNFWWYKGRALQIVPLCFSHRDASLICILTYLGRHVTSRDPDLRSYFNLDLKISMQMFRRVSTRETRWHSKPQAFFVHKLFA